MKARLRDKIVVKAMKQSMELLEERIRETYETAINNGNHPKEWRRAIGAIIPKPKKQDYMRVKSYRPVSLQNTLAKRLENVVGERLIRKAEDNEEKGLDRTQ